MKNIKKISSTYTYPAKSKSSPAIEVGFFLDSRLDRYDNVLRKINVTDKYGQNHVIEYFGKSLMISVKTSSKTTMVRRANRDDLVKYKEAYFSYLSELTLEDKKLHEVKTYLFLEELPPVEDKIAIGTSVVKNDELDSAKSEIAALKAELEKSKEKPKKAKASAKAEPESEKSE